MVHGPGVYGVPKSRTAGVASQRVQQLVPAVPRVSGAKCHYRTVRPSARTALSENESRGDISSTGIRSRGRELLASRATKRFPTNPPHSPSHRLEERSIASIASIDGDDGPKKASTSEGLTWLITLPARYQVVGATMLAFVVCNLDKVVMSVCIIPMALDYGWSSSVSGLVQSAFFWGYLLCQLPGGAFINRLGGRRVLPIGVAGFSLATAVLPLVAASVPGLCLSRVIVGAGESIAPSAATDMVARIIPSSERSRAVSFIFSGLHLGSIVGLLAAPWLISHVDWEATFVCFGICGLVWALWFEHLLARLATSDPGVVGRLTAQAGPSAAALSREAAGGMAAANQPIPWRAFLRERSVQALMFTHFCNNWLHYTFMAWLPTYFTDTLSVDLMHAAQTALLPPLAGIAASAVAGPAADAMIERGIPVAFVRKLAQGIAFLAPTACLLATFNDNVSSNTTLTVAAVTVALGLSSFSLAGLYCTHQDLSPRYASSLLGLTNSAGAVPGIVGVTVVGYLFDMTGSWEMSLFLPSAIFLLAGAVVYTALGTHEPVDFDEKDNTPFFFEPRWPLWK